MRRRSPRPVGYALRSALDRLQPPSALAAVQRAWEDAVGRAIAKEARPVAEQDGVVTVSCSSSTWAAELDLMQHELRVRLEDRLPPGTVRSLRLVTDGAKAR